MLANLAMASNPLILYTFSAEYRRIFQKQLLRLFGNKISRTRSVTSVVPTRGSTLHDNNNNLTRAVSSSSAF
uniref:Uncharacterized protein n=1 Tax=Ditylenchus dipsaci TaxID=166011 RepID=A0A915E8W3_9BILA